MKVYSDTLTRDDLVDALPRGVTLDSCEPISGARVRANGWTVALRCWGSSRHVNTGQYGAGEQGAASYEQHGVWMAALFAKDPAARIAYYDGRADFERATDGRFSTKTIRARLEYLRQELRAERISYGDLAELQGLAEHIDAGDVELLEPAGVPEHGEEAMPV